MERKQWKVDSKGLDSSTRLLRVNLVLAWGEGGSYVRAGGAAD